MYVYVNLILVNRVTALLVTFSHWALQLSPLPIALREWHHCTRFTDNVLNAACDIITRSFVAATPLFFFYVGARFVDRGICGASHRKELRAHLRSNAARSNPLPSPTKAHWANRLVRATWWWQRDCLWTELMLHIQPSTLNCYYWASLNTARSRNPRAEWVYIN